MQRGSKHTLLAMFLVFLAVSLSAQENSPYSSHGIGDVEGTNFSASKGMGGISAGFRDAYQINTTNPASYSWLRRTSFEAGVDFRTMNLHRADTSFQTGTAFLDYLALAFPLNNQNTAISFGILPYSKVSYISEVANSADDVEGVRNQFNGDGRLYKLYAGAAHAFNFGDVAYTEQQLFTTTAIIDTVPVIRNQISIGFNAAYLFGQLAQSTVVTLPDSVQAFNARKTANWRVGDMTWDFGTQYQRILNDTTQLAVVVGAWTQLPFKVNGKLEETWDRFRYVNGFEQVIDTISFVEGAKKKITFPAQFGLGFTVRRGYGWQLGADLSYTMWSKLGDVPISKNDNLRNSWRLGLGGEIYPKMVDKFGDKKRQNSKDPFFTKMIYRLGGYYDSGYITVNGRDVKEYGITFGLGIPVKESMSRINLSFEVGKRGTNSDEILSETFVKAYLGLTLNDRWFYKRKYN